MYVYPSPRCIITFIAMGIIAAAAQTGSIIVSSSMNLAMVTVQYTQKVGTAVITTNNIYSGTTRGMNVVALDRDVGNITYSGAFDTFASTSEVDRLYTFINSIPDGEILCFAIRDEATNNLYNRSIFKQLGSQYINIVSYRGFWNFVVVKEGGVIGENYINDPDLSGWPPPLTLTVSFQLPVTAPYNITALNITSTSVTLKWNKPLYYPTVILKYAVDYYPDGNVGSSMEASTAGSTPMLVISGLSGGTLYTFIVRVGTGGGGVSSYSNPVNASTLVDAPGPVSDVKVTASSFTTITLQWMPPLRTNGIIIKYKVQCLGVVTYTNRLSVTLSGLYPASAYNISVTASTSKGPGPQSYILANTTATPIVTGISVLTVNETAVRVCWDPVQLPSDGMLVGYSVYYGDSSMQMDGYTNKSFPGSYTWGDISGLYPNHMYLFGVTAEVSVNGLLLYGQKQLLIKNDKPADQTSTLIALGSSLGASFVLILILLLIIVIVTALLKWRTASTTHHNDQSNNEKPFTLDTCAAYEMTTGRFAEHIYD